MASEFIGLLMMVTMRGTPPMLLKGTVSAVEAGTGLTLSNVWVTNTKEWKPRLTIPSEDIVDLSELPSEPVAPPLAHGVPANPPAPAPAPPVAQQPPPQPVFVDPAIVAVGKPAASASSSSSRAPEPHPQPNTSEKRDPGPGVVPPVQILSASREVTPTNTVAASLRDLKLDPSSAAVESADEDGADRALDYGEVTAQKKKRRQRKPGSAKTATQADYGASPAPTEKAAGRGRGWRQTPILQSTASFQPFSSLKRNRKGRQMADNGWASEDVTDVQEMGDFDFEGGLAKFDKQNLFEQMRKDDLIDEADRLVSHNRLPRPKPGTAGGKNLHYSENVLDLPSTASRAAKDRPASSKETPNDFWNSEADDGLPHGDRPSTRDQSMGSRQSSRRGGEGKSAAAGKRSRSRKAHEMARTGSGPGRVASGLSTPAAPQGLYALPSNRRIEPVSALQMLNLENIAHNEIGLTEEMMTENAGRGIAEVTLIALADPAIKVRHAGSVDPATGNPPPQTVVVLAGNNKSGSRAIAAARHLRNKGINVLVCVVGLERGERDLFEDVQQQVRLYRNLGGRVFTKSDFFEHIRKMSIPTLTIDTPRASLGSLANPAPVMLIIDALLGLAISFEELRNGDQATVYELIEWANRNEAFVMAVDVPSGLDPTTGKVSVVDGNRLYVKPRHVVAVGAPKRGLLEALIAADDNGDGDTILAGGEAPVPDDSVLEWKLYLVDMGLGQAVWKKAGTRMRKGVDFGEKWVLEMKYRGIVPSDAEEEEEVV
ncbi:hypothetical protein MYCTH_2304592 [Thermothelomyces thermophilus ATCC 42464]|uniref:Enhancer of mRNA-decapping protein 3 n=1 Tax=Thermothelomyces thermophilus (strain ATCC 42464 / BCRC 31852 / DSM 1799) TaxID=573729 RepID=G2QBD1_THET4|nr:uncharacterized protein MYCTH_2304592 [Thermothelomyces thermophilus ATCC 42464]AEO57874.1 hypothetical protein MYCTH_2304592 [Thermothelomyces thermophilus ATCC 42464]